MLVLVGFATYRAVLSVPRVAFKTMASSFSMAFCPSSQYFIRLLPLYLWQGAGGAECSQRSVTKGIGFLATPSLASSFWGPAMRDSKKDTTANRQKTRHSFYRLGGDRERNVQNFGVIRP